jgi:hypothetical protein
MSRDNLEDLRALWRDQPTGPAPAQVTPEALSARSDKLARQSRRRNVRETVAGVVGGAATLAVGWSMPIPLTQIGCVLLVLGEVWVLAVLWRRGRARPAPPPTAPTAEHLGHLRAELVRERDLLASVLGWYLAPLIPGFVLIPLGMILEVAKRAHAAWAWLTMLTTLACTVLVFVFIVWLNRRKAASLAREIEALDAGGSR